MPGIIDAWKDASVAQKVGIITASTLAVGGVVYGIYRLKVQTKDPPPRPSTPVRRVDPFENVESVPPPKTPPKTPPKPKLSFTSEGKPQFTSQEKPLDLSEKVNPKTPPSSPIGDEPGPLSSSTLASFEPISMSQVSSIPCTESPPSMPSLHISPPNVQLGGPSSNTSSTSPGTGDSSLSFVKLSMEDEPQPADDVIKAEETQQAFAAPPPKPETPPLDQSSGVVTPSTADTTISFVNLSKDDDGMEKSQSPRDRERSVEEELEELKLRRARAEEDDAPDDGTTMATIGSDTERTVGGDQDIVADFESEQGGKEEEEEEASQSGDSDIQRLEEDEPEPSTSEEPSVPEPPKPEVSQATSREQPSSTQASGDDEKLKEKDENDIVVISTDSKEGEK